jgi:putative SOS response-associated peptidase YedK
MCGRYASARPVDEIASVFGVADGHVEGPPAPDWNIAPTKPVPVVVERSGRRVLTAMRWGLVPAWADDPSIGSRLINARIETVADKPAFRDALAVRRCILPADGWYEWRRRPDGASQPYYLSSGELLAFAGLWAVWQDAEGAPLVSTVILTGTAPNDLAFIHDRAPVVLAREHWGRWLQADAVDAATALMLLRPTSESTVAASAVGPAVGDVRSNGPQLTVPVPVDEQPTLF